jgi:anti-sigma factor RsiW
MTCQDAAPALGAYVLGALEPDEARRVEEHVRDCPACAAELTEFESLPPLLDRVSLQDLEAEPVTPSPDLFERVSAAAAASAVPDRSIARNRRWLVAAAAVLVLGTGAGVTWGVTVSAVAERAHSAVAGSVHMTVTADPQPAGTVLDVSVAGVAPGEQCRLVVIGRNGARSEAGTWTASYAGNASFRGWTSVHRHDVTAVVLLGTNMQQLVRVPL